MSKPSVKTSFMRAQLASLVASVVDFGTLIFLVEVGRVWYLYATVTGAVLGAVTNFSMGRYWSFEATDRPVQGQAFRYAVVAAGSLGLNVLGVFLFTEYVKLPYWMSKAVTSILVGVFFNFTMHRKFVF